MREFAPLAPVEQLLVPFIVVTGQGNEKAAVDVMEQGALDRPAVVKGTLDSVAQSKELITGDG